MKFLLFRSLDAVRTVDDRARDLRTRATELPARPCLPAPAAPDRMPLPDDGQADYVSLIGLANGSPHEVFVRGAELVTREAVALADLLAIPGWRTTTGLLNRFERLHLVNFQEYALLRDLLTLARDVKGESAHAISRASALDFALAVRGAQRLLRSLTEEQSRATLSTS